MNYFGIILGVISFVIIGCWHPIVVKGEYYFGKRKCTVIFFAIGIICVLISLNIENLMLSTAVAIFGFSSFWGIKEVFEQEKRVKRGWFPKNDKRNEK